MSVICQFTNLLGTVVQNYRSATHLKKSQMNVANFDSFKTKISCVDWRAVDEADPSVLYDCFHNKSACIYEESFPVQEKTYRVFKNKYKPWITTAILNSVKERINCIKTMCRQNLLNQNLIYRSYKNKLTTIIRLSQKKVLC